MVSGILEVFLNTNSIVSKPYCADEQAFQKFCALVDLNRWLAGATSKYINAACLTTTDDYKLAHYDVSTSIRKDRAYIKSQNVRFEVSFG